MIEEDTKSRKKSTSLTLYFTKYIFGKRIFPSDLQLNSPPPPPIWATPIPPKTRSSLPPSVSVSIGLQRGEGRGGGVLSALSRIFFRSACPWEEEEEERRERAQSRPRIWANAAVEALCMTALSRLQGWPRLLF